MIWHKQAELHNELLNNGDAIMPNGDFGLFPRVEGPVNGFHGPPETLRARVLWRIRAVRR